jgi:hypothetical protein
MPAAGIDCIVSTTAEVHSRADAGGTQMMKMKLSRRRFLHLAAGAAALPAVSHIARAQVYPTRPVRLVVGFPQVARAICLHVCSPNGFQSGSASNSLSRTERALAEISVPRQSCVRPQTATRCF